MFSHDFGTCLFLWIFNTCDTHYTTTFFSNKSSVKIRWTVVCGIPVSASTSFTITHWSSASTVATIAVLVLSITVEGWPDHRLSSVLILPSLKHLHHRWTVFLPSVAFLQTSFNKQGWWELHCQTKFQSWCMHTVRTLKCESRNFLLHLWTTLTLRDINERNIKITAFFL